MTAGCSAPAIRCRARWRCWRKPRRWARCAATGWRPKRTIVYTSWDGEEPGLLGSTEWAETHADELKQKAVLYINSDTNHRGILSRRRQPGFRGGWSPMRVAKNVTDPETANVSRRRAHARAVCGSRRAIHTANDKDHAKAMAAFAADPARDLPIDAAGVGFGLWRASSIIWAFPRSISDMAAKASRAASITRATTRSSITAASSIRASSTIRCWRRPSGGVVITAADSDLPLQRASDFASEIAQDLKEVKKLADRPAREGRETGGAAARPCLRARRRSDQAARRARRRSSRCRRSISRRSIRLSRD